MNLDYRSGKIHFDDLNCEKNYDKSAAFSQSQLANMLAVTALAEELRPDGVSVAAAYPGVVGGTGIKRHMGVDRSISGSLISGPLLWFLTVTPTTAARGPFRLATEGFKSGALYSAGGRKEMEVSAAAANPEEARRMLAVAKYWSGQAGSKEEVARTLKSVSVGGAS